MFSKLLLFSALAFLGGKYFQSSILGQWGTFAVVLGAQIAVNLAFVCCLWPFVLSPLRKLPGPKVSAAHSMNLTAAVDSTLCRAEAFFSDMHSKNLVVLQVC